MNYRAEIDGLRALAVLPVILFHAGFEWFSGGFVGVDVFFVISGYLITNIIISEMANGTFNIVSFYERRARRILPALFFVMLFCLPFAWLWLTPSDLEDFGSSLIAVSTFSSNILFWLGAGYFDTSTELKPLLHTWSLAVEEQYYILFPVFLMLTWKLGLKWVLTILSLTFVMSLGAAQWGAFNKPGFTFYMLPTRSWELLVGVFVAFYVKHRGTIRIHAVNQLLSVLGIGMVIYSIVVFDEDIPFPSFYALVPTMGTAFIILSAVPNTAVQKVLSLPPIVGVGLISYSAYLWHQPLLAFARHRLLGSTSEVLLIALCIASLFMAYTSWRWVEKPFRDKNRISRRKIFSLSLIGIVFFSLMGWLAHFASGFSDRIENKLDFETLSSSPLRDKCHSKFEPCEYLGDSIEWASFGDSHTVELSYALAKLLDKQGVGIEHNSYSRCKPTLSDNVGLCLKWTNETLERLKQNIQIKNVVISYRLTLYLFGESLGHYPALPDIKSESERDEIWNDLLKIFQSLIDADKTVYFVIQPPELPMYIEKIAFWQGNSSQKVKGVRRAWWDKRNSYVYDRLDEIPEDVRIIDPIGIFCDSELCDGSDLNGYLYFDDDHVSVYGASKIARMILSKAK